MNAHVPLTRSVVPPTSTGKSIPANPTPADLTLTVRDRRLARDARPQRWWLNGDPVATAWYNALSGTFPRGEAFFIEAVKAHRDGVPPKLADEIRSFIVQEINHTREHLAFNRIAEGAGYDMAMVDSRVDALLHQLDGRPRILDLASTMALEHFTAMMAQKILSRPEHLAGADPEVAKLWRWHAIEEIEHKGVAYDTWLHATRGWGRFRRWRVKALTMLVVTRHFFAHRTRDTLDFLARDGITGGKARLRLIRFLLAKPGMIRQILPDWLRYFGPGFHPWNTDDRAMIAAAEASLGDIRRQA